MAEGLFSKNGFYSRSVCLEEGLFMAEQIYAEKSLEQRSCNGRETRVWRLICIWWRRLLLYLSVGLGCMVI